MHKIKHHMLLRGDVLHFSACSDFGGAKVQEFMEKKETRLKFSQSKAEGKKYTIVSTWSLFCFQTSVSGICLSDSIQNKYLIRPYVYYHN